MAQVSDRPREVFCLGENVKLEKVLGTIKLFVIHYERHCLPSTTIRSLLYLLSSSTVHELLLTRWIYMLVIWTMIKPLGQESGSFDGSCSWLNGSVFSGCERSYVNVDINPCTRNTCFYLMFFRYTQYTCT